MLKTLFGNKRGLSPVISSLLLTAAVIAIGTAVLFWANSTYSSHQSGTGAFLSSKSESLKESLVIEDVWFYEGNPKYVNVTVRNVGTVYLEVASIYLRNSTHEEVWNGGRGIEVGEAATIKVFFDWDSSEYCIIVATARGNQVREWYSTSG